MINLWRSPSCTRPTAYLYWQGRRRRVGPQPLYHCAVVLVIMRGVEYVLGAAVALFQLLPDSAASIFSEKF